MEKSESIINIAKALIEFSIKVGKITKDEKNPFYGSSYASLSAMQDAIQLPLAESGMALTQVPDGDCLTTLLIHAESGEFLQSSYNIHASKIDPQGIGSAITYARRYAIGAILNLSIDTDTDGQPTAVKYNGKYPQILMKETLEELKKYWEENPLLQTEKQFSNEVAKRKLELSK